VEIGEDGGEYLKTVWGEAIPLRQQSFKWQTIRDVPDGLATTVFKIGVSAMPTSVNIEAKLVPHETKLVFFCREKEQILINYNYPVNGVLEWNMELCSQVSIEIGVGKKKLVKRYMGNSALVKFLKEFPEGERVFTLRDFNKDSEWLKSKDIDHFVVKYGFQGHESAKTALRRVNVRLPSKITEEVGTI